MLEYVIMFLLGIYVFGILNMSSVFLWLRSFSDWRPEKLEWLELMVIIILWPIMLPYNMIKNKG